MKRCAIVLVVVAALLGSLTPTAAHAATQTVYGPYVGTAQGWTDPTPNQFHCHGRHLVIGAGPFYNIRTAIYWCVNVDKKQVHLAWADNDRSTIEDTYTVIPWKGGEAYEYRAKNPNPGPHNKYVRWYALLTWSGEYRWKAIET